MSSEFAPGSSLPKVALAEREAVSADELVTDYLGRLAIREMSTVEPSNAFSHAFNALVDVSPEEVTLAIETVGQAELLPGIMEANRKLVDLGDWGTIYHQYRTAILSVVAANRVGNIAPEYVLKLAAAAICHDNGKAHPTVWRAVSKTDPWIDDDRRDMTLHPKAGRDNARAVGVTDPLVLYLIESHHWAQRADPYGLNEPVAGISPVLKTQLRRLLTISDTVDACCNPREEYRPFALVVADVVNTRIPNDLAVRRTDALRVFREMVSA